MRFTFFSVACILGSAIAAPIETAETAVTATSDIKLVANYFARLTTTLGSIDSAMRSRPSGGDTAEAQRQTDNLLSLTNKAIEELRLGSRDIRRDQPTIGSLEGMTLMTPLNNLSTQLQRVADGWTSSKDMVVAAGKKSAVLNTMLDASEATIVFSDAIIQKIPLVEQYIGQGYKTQFMNIIEKTIQIYKKA